MSLHRVRLRDIAPQPWRNGGGSTREMLRWPPATNEWALRVSVAEIDRDGPFSPYPGIERWFAVLEGAGVRLEMAQGERELVRGGDPVQFAGEQAPGCRLVDGPTRDLNLMLRRSACVGQARLARAGEHFDEAASWRALYAATAVRVQTGPCTSEALEAGTLLWADAADSADGCPWRLLDAGLAFWMICMSAPR